MEELYSFIEKNPTVAVSITAIIFTFLGTVVTLFVTRWNLNRQLSIQLATTVEKEWIQKIRDYVATINYQGSYLSDCFATNIKPDVNREAQFLSSIESVKLYLDIANNSLQMRLLQDILQLKVLAYNTKTLDDVAAVIDLTSGIAGKVVAIAKTNQLNK